MKKRVKLWSLALLGVTMMSVTGIAFSQVQADTTTSDYTVTITSGMQGNTIALLNDEIAEFALNYTKGSAINYAPADGVATDRYIPKPATISWGNSRGDALYYTLRVGLEEDFSDAESYLVSETTAERECGLRCIA